MRVWLTAIFALWLAAPAVAQTTAPDDSVVTLGLKPNVRLGDFDAMKERRLVRVLVPYSRTLYFSDRGKEHGITADNVRDFETFINKKYRRELHNRPITVVIIPTPRNKLLARVAAGYGDIAAGNLTMTPERLLLTDFYVPPNFSSVSELVLTSPAVGPLASADDLSGKTVHVRASSSYYASLLELNERLAAAGRPLVNIVRVQDALEDEDLMEMLDAGVLGAIVVDDWKAHMWAKVLPHMIVNDNASVRTGGQLGWAIRKNSPQLMTELGAFYKEYQKVGTFSYRVVQYNKQVKRLQDPTGRNDWKRFEQTIALFQKYGGEYGFDPLLLAAQGYQESKLNQSARGPTGAVGIMQLMPKTGASMKVGDITVTEPNIHAGTKYMNKVMSDYFQDAHFDPLNRTLFAFAAYNAGPTRISKLRKVAAERGLDPDVWFDNVEVVVSEKIGRETTTYVRNILKYYVAYTLMEDRAAAQERAREQLEKNKN